MKADQTPTAARLMADEIERQAARITRSQTRLGVNGTLVSDLGFYVMEYLPDLLKALRAPQNDGAAAMREAIARWHDEIADDRARRLNVRDKHREVYDLLFAERVIHRDCARAVRSMPLPPALASQEPGTGGERA